MPPFSFNTHDFSFVLFLSSVTWFNNLCVMYLHMFCECAIKMSELFKFFATLSVFVDYYFMQFNEVIIMTLYTLPLLTDHLSITRTFLKKQKKLSLNKQVEQIQFDNNIFIKMMMTMIRCCSCIFMPLSLVKSFVKIFFADC